MIEVNFKVNSMQIWLGELISSKQLMESQNLRRRQLAGDLNHNSFLYNHSIQGEKGFIPLENIGQQAFCQTLAHYGCIPSILLFGYSLSTAYSKTRRVYCDINAYEYCFIGIEMIMNQHLENGFIPAANLLTSSETLYKICDYLITSYSTLGFNHKNHPVIDFALICMAGLKNELRFDA